MDIDYDINDNSYCDYEEGFCSSPISDSFAPSYPPPEVKSIELPTAGSSAGTSLALTNAGVVVALNDDIVSGTSLNTATGNQYTVQSLSYNFSLPSSIADSTIARLSIVWDRQPNGVTATYGDIYSTSGTSFSATNVFAHQNLDNRQRFIILRTFLFPSPVTGRVS